MPLTRRIIPCLDVAGGRVVKGLRFRSLKDAGDAVSLARRYAGEGADELVFLDITASEERRETIRSLVEDVARVLDIPFTVGGGVSSMQDARNILLSGADKVAVNTGAVENRALLTDLMRVFGRQCVVVAIDAKRSYDTPCPDARLYEDDAGTRYWFEVHTYGGKRPTGLDAICWAKEAERLGAGEILLTSMDRDGTHDGYDDILTQAVADSVRIPVIASGGCGKPEHMVDIFGKSDADAALAASIFHYDSYGIRHVKEFLRERGIRVRL